MPCGSYPLISWPQGDHQLSIPLESHDICATRDGQGRVKLWDLKTRRTRTEFHDTQSSILSLSHLTGSQSLITSVPSLPPPLSLPPSVL